MGIWVGMKFVVTTAPGTVNVNLELYVDENDDGNWQIKHSLTDTPGSWLSTSSTTVPSECPQNDGDTVVRAGNVSFLRTDGGDLTTEVHWRDVFVMSSLAPVLPSVSPTSVPTAPPSLSPMNPPTTPPPTVSFVFYIILIHTRVFAAHWLASLFALLRRAQQLRYVIASFSLFSCHCRFV